MGCFRLANRFLEFGHDLVKVRVKNHGHRSVSCESTRIYKPRCRNYTVIDSILDGQDPLVELN